MRAPYKSLCKMRKRCYDNVNSVCARGKIASNEWEERLNSVWTWTLWGYQLHYLTVINDPAQCTDGNISMVNIYDSSLNPKGIFSAAYLEGDARRQFQKKFFLMPNRNKICLHEVIVRQTVRQLLLTNPRLHFIIRITTHGALQPVI